MVTISELKSLNEKVKQKEKAFIEAEAEKKELIKTLENIKYDVDSEKDIPKAIRDEFKSYIDAIIANNGKRPDVNPIKTYVDTLNEEAENKYNKAKKAIDLMDM